MAAVEPKQFLDEGIDRFGFPHEFGKKRHSPATWSLPDGGTIEQLRAAKLQDQIVFQLREMFDTDSLTDFCAARHLDYETTRQVVAGERPLSMPHLAGILERVPEHHLALSHLDYSSVPPPRRPSFTERNARIAGALNPTDFKAAKDDIDEGVFALLMDRRLGKAIRSKGRIERNVDVRSAYRPAGGFADANGWHLRLFLPGNWRDQVDAVGGALTKDGRLIIQIHDLDAGGMPESIHVLELVELTGNGDYSFVGSVEPLA